MSILRKLFPPDDWTLIHVLQGTWMENDKNLDVCYYEFHYSEFRKRVKLEIGGLDPKKHKVYKIAAELLYKLNLEASSGKPNLSEEATTIQAIKNIK